MRLEPTPEMDRLYNIAKPHLKRNEKGTYMPDDAPEKAKESFEKWLELSKEQYDEEVASWWE